MSNGLDNPAIGGFVLTSRDVTERTEAAKALRQSEERFRGLLEAAPDAIVTCTADGRIVLVNSEAERLFGYTRDELVGQSVDLLLPEGLQAQHRARYVADPHTRPMGRGLELFARTKEGRAVPVEISLSPLTHDRELLVTAIIRDITERKAAADALRQEAAQRAAIIAAQQDVATAGLDLELVLERISRCAQDLTGASGAVVEMMDGEEMVYRAASGTAAPHVGLRLPLTGSLSGLAARSELVLRCDETETDPRVDRAACQRIGVRSMILVPLRQAGVTVGVLKVLAPHPRAFAARDVEVLQVVAGVLGAALSQAAAFDALRASEERYRQVEAYAPIGLALVSPQGRWQRVNPALCALLGYSAEELLARTFQDLTHPDDLAADLAYMRQMLAGEIPTYQMEKRYLRKDGTPVWILLSVALVRDEAGAPLYFISQIQDIDARRRAEAALAQANRELARSNAELEQFARVASHDLRAPLSSIGGFAQLLQLRYQGQLDEQADQYIAFITAGVARMQALISGLLAYARLDTRAAPHTPVDGTALLREVLADLYAQIEEAGATVDAGALPVMWGDELQLGQLLQNLIANAIRFRHPGRAPHVQVAARRDGAVWELTVRDNGIGLDPAQASRIFEMFGRLHGQDEYEGTGIGLAVCQKIAERHGGRIWVTSQPGAGATFHVTLPAVETC